MSIIQIENAKRLQIQGARLGRDGLSQRVDELILAFAKEHPTGHYRDGIMLAGRLHAIFLATNPHDYWREVAERGFHSEIYDLESFDKKIIEEKE
jgi:hypothetical protein